MEGGSKAEREIFKKECRISASNGVVLGALYTVEEDEPVYALHTKTTRGRGGVPCVERAALVLHTEVEQRALWSDPTSVANTAAATTLPVERAIHI